MKTRIQKIINFYMLLCLLFTTENILGSTYGTAPRKKSYTTSYTNNHIPGFNNFGLTPTLPTTPSGGNVSAVKSTTSTSGATAQSSPQLQTQKAAPPKQTTPNSPQEQPTRSLKIDPSRINQSQTNMAADKVAMQKALPFPTTRSYQAPKVMGKVNTGNFSNISTLFEKRKNISIDRDDNGGITELVQKDDLGSIHITKNPSLPNYTKIKIQNNDGSFSPIIQDDANVQPDKISGASATTKTYFNKLANENPRAKFYTEPTREGEIKNKRVVIADEQSTKIIELNKDGAIVKNREYKKNDAFKDLETPENINISSEPAVTPNSDPEMFNSEKMEAPLERYTTKLKNDASTAYPRIPKNVLDDLLPSYAREAIDVAATGYTGGAVLGYTKVAPTSVNFASRGQQKPRTDLQKASAGLDAIQEAFAENPTFDKTYQTTYQDEYMSGPAQDYVVALRHKFPNAPDSIIRSYVTEYLNTMPRENVYKSFFSRDSNKPQVIPASKIADDPDWDTTTKREMGDDVVYETPTRLQKMYAGLQGMESIATKANIANEAAANPALATLLYSAPRRLATDPRAFLQEVLTNPSISDLGSSGSDITKKAIEAVQSYVKSPKGQLDSKTRIAINRLLNEVVRTTARTSEAVITSIKTTVIDFFTPIDPAENQPPSMFSIDPTTYEALDNLRKTTIGAVATIANNEQVQAATKAAVNNLGNDALEAGANALTETIKPFTQGTSPTATAQTNSYFTTTEKTRSALKVAEETATDAAIQLGNKGLQALANTVVNTAEKYSQPTDDASARQDSTPATSIITPENLQAWTRAANALKNAALTQAEIALGMKPQADPTQTPKNPITTRKRSNSMSQMPTEQAPGIQRSRSFSQGDEPPTNSKKTTSSKDKSESTDTTAPATPKSTVKTGSITSFFSSGIEKLRNSPEKIRAFVSSSIDKISDLLGVTPKNKAAAQQKADIEITNAIKNKNSWFYAKDAATFHNGVNALITSFYKSIGRDNPAQTKIIEISNQSNPKSPNITFAYHEGRVKTATVEYNGNKFKVNKEKIREQKNPDGSVEYIITTPLFTTPQELTLAQKINNKLFNTTIKNNLVEPVRQTEAGRMIDQAQPGALDSIKNLLTASGSQSDGRLELKVKKNSITSNITRKNPEGSTITTTKEYTTQDPESAAQTSHKVAIEPAPGDNFSPSIKIQYDQNERPTITATYKHYSTGKVFTKTVNPEDISYNHTFDTYSVMIEKPQATVSREQAIVDEGGKQLYKAGVNNAGSTWAGGRLEHAAPKIFKQGQDYLLSDYENDFAGLTVRISPSRNTITTLVQQRMNKGGTTTKTLQYPMD